MNDRDRAKFLTGLIGKKYLVHGTGPDAFDCEGLARLVLKTVFSFDLPSVEDAALARRAVSRIMMPVDGAIVFTGSNADDRHIGVFLKENGGGIIHAFDGVGVVFDSLLTFRVRCPNRMRLYATHSP